jgi:hypothetical protein
MPSSKFCLAEWNDYPISTYDAKTRRWTESPQMPLGYVSCFLAPDHDGPHETWLPIPCPTCCGMDAHFADCPDIGLVTNDAVYLHFDDDGWLWADRIDGNSGHYVYEPKAAHIDGSGAVS